MHDTSNSDSNNKVTSWSRKIKPNYKLPIFILLLVIFIAFCIFLLVRNNQQNAKIMKNAQYQKSIQKQVKIANLENANDVVRVYGKEKGQYSKELQSSDSATWDKAKLDKVYFNLIYADKVGSFNDVYAMLAFIDAAKKSGLNIDDNSYGIDQTKRNEIKLRADKIVESRMKGTTKQ